MLTAESFKWSVVDSESCADAQIAQKTFEAIVANKPENSPGHV